MIIGFCGLAGAGKTTAALHLVETRGFVRERFAGPLKAALLALGLTEREVDGDLKEAPCAMLAGKTPRQAMQLLGKEWGRDLISPDLWVDAWGRRVDQRAADVVVDDVRFVNEAAAIWARGGKVVMLRRHGAGSTSGGGHASEALGFPWDYEIHNDGDVGRLQAQVETLAALLRGRGETRKAAHV